MTRIVRRKKKRIVKSERKRPKRLERCNVTRTSPAIAVSDVGGRGTQA